MCEKRRCVPWTFQMLADETEDGVAETSDSVTE